MKLIAAFAALAMAQEETNEGPNMWDGVSETETCGMQFSSDESIVNKTCTLFGENIAYVFAGNGAVITGPRTFTGYDDVSSTLDLVVFFDQNCPDGKCSNATCWNLSLGCEPNPGNTAYQGVGFMETINDHRHGPGASYSLQIYGAKKGDTLAIDLNGWSAQNITTAFGTVLAQEDPWGNQVADTGSFSVQINDQPFGSLFQISVTGTGDSPPNLWASSVSN